MNPLATIRIDLAALALSLGAAGLAGCRHDQPHVQPETQAPPTQTASRQEEPIMAPAPYWPPGPPPGTPVQEIGTWDRLGLLIGYTQFDSSWDPFEGQPGLRLTGTHEWRNAVVGIEWSVAYSGTSDSELGLRFTNQNFGLSVGPTKTFHLGGKWFTNLGLGVAWTYTEEGENTGLIGVQGQHDGWFAGYGHVSLIYRLFPAWDLALDLRGVKGEDVELGPFELEGQYWQLAFGFGIGI